MSIKILQVGAGIRGRHWLDFVRRHPDVECVGLVEPDPDSRGKAQSMLGDSGCRVFDDVDSALRELSVDGALVVSPSATHASISEKCIDAGLTVMVEKPLSVTVEEGRRLLLRAPAVGRQVLLG